MELKKFGKVIKKSQMKEKYEASWTSGNREDESRNKAIGHMLMAAGEEGTDGFEGGAVRAWGWRGRNIERQQTATRMSPRGKAPLSTGGIVAGSTIPPYVREGTTA